MIATHPPASEDCARIVGTLGIMATRVPKGSTRPRTGAPARSPGSPARAPDGEARVRSRNAMPPPRTASAGRTASRKGTAGKGGAGKGGARGGSGRGGTGRGGTGRGAANSGRRPARKGRSAAARPPTADPILILLGWLGSLLAAAWMLVAHAAGGAARAFGASARDLDPLHRRDGAGLAWLAAAIAVAATTWWRLDNAAGRTMTAVVRGAFGSAAWALPILLGLLAWRYLRHPERNAQTGRMVIGWTALLLGGLGLVHIAAGTPSPSAGTAAMQSGGGLIGFAGVRAAGSRAHPMGRRAAARPGQRLRPAGHHRPPRCTGCRTGSPSCVASPGAVNRTASQQQRPRMPRLPGNSARAAGSGRRPSRPASTPAVRHAPAVRRPGRARAR